MKSYSAAQEELLSECPNGYKLNGYVHDHNVPLRGFIILFLFFLRNRYETVTNNVIVNYTVCGVGKKRSVSDTFLICRYYYPNCTLKEVREIMLQLTLGSHVCEGEDKRVFAPSHKRVIKDLIKPDEFGWYVDSQIED